MRSWIEKIWTTLVPSAAEDSPSAGSTLAQGRVLELYDLEDRILFNATPIAVEALVAANDSAPSADTSTSPATDTQVDSAATSDGQQPAATVVCQADDNGCAVNESSHELRQEVVFVDAGVENYQELVQKILSRDGQERELTVVVLDENRDGIEQISAALAQQHDLDAVHILSHGSAGLLKLGTTFLNGNSVSGYAADISGWSNALASDADLMIYGCDLVANEQGRLLVDSLASLTGADVAASVDDTGAADLGGNWELEYRIGAVTTTTVLDSDLAADWHALMSTYTVTNTNDSGSGSLRQAIINANNNAGADTINFNIGSGTQTISILSTLPTITGQVTIDGWTQPGYSGTPRIIIDANQNATIGFELNSNADGSTIRGLIIRDFSSHAIQIDSGSDNNVIAGNYIGSFGAGGTDQGAAEANGGNGIYVLGSNNTIGGTTAATRNLIAGNDGGISVNGTSANYNVITGNYVGTDVTGTVDIGNTNSGINIWNGSNNTIGGTSAGAGNLISGNGTDGITISGSSATANVIQGNIIGLNASSTGVLRNDAQGIWIGSSSYGNTIGGTSAGAGNVIGGNQWAAVELNNSSNNYVQGNYIGTNSSSATGLGNGAGVLISTGSQGNTIGGTTASARNIISGNTGNGIQIMDTSTNNNVLQGNYIGTNVAGTAALANGGYGIEIYNSATSNTIGGSSSARNVISGNAYNGIYIFSAANNTTIRSNYIGLNAAGTAAIANGEAGIYLKDVTGTAIGGTSAGQGNVISGNTQQGIYFNNADNSTVYANYIGTDAAGTGDINGTSGNVQQSGFILMGGSSGNTIGNGASSGRNFISGNNHYGMEIQDSTSQNNTVNGNYIGTTTTGTAALGNTNGGFSFWGAGSGNVLKNNTISGNLAVGVLISNAASSATVQGNYIGLGSDGSTIVGNGTYGILVSGAATNALIGSNGDGSNDAGERNVISGNQIGIMLSDAGTTGAMVYGNYIGTSSGGSTAKANTGDGIRIENGATNNYIGATGSARRNVISGNGGDGIQIDGEATDGNSIVNNYIGLGADGATVLGNSGNGIYITNGADNTTIGGGTGSGNTIVGNGLSGIAIDGASTGTSIKGNYIGTNSAGTVNGGNSQYGITLSNNAANSTIGTTTSGEGNVITNATGSYAAVMLTTTAGTGNSIVGNSIYNNNSIGIDLGTAGVTANDNLDPDSGANNLQNFPVITSATTDEISSLSISGTLNSLASLTGVVIHFYSTSTGTTSSRQGKKYLGSTTVNTDASGNATFTNVSFATLVNAGEIITATATYSNNTSEFSLGYVVVSSANQLVVANDDTPSIVEDASTVLDPRTNDTDGNGDSLQIIDFTSTSNGTLGNTGDGTLTYNPNSNYNGGDSFDYMVIDSGAGLTHFWALNGDAVDSIGGTNGTVTEAATVTGSFKQGYSFDEVNDVITTSDFAYSNSFTITFDFKVDDNSGTTFQYLYSHGTVSTANSINIYIGEASQTYANQLFTNIQDSNDATYAQEMNVNIASLIGDGQWHTYTLTVQTGIGSKVYLDGVLAASDAARGGDAMDPTTGLYLGGRNDLDANRYYGGMLDTVAVANRAFTASEAAAWANQGNVATSTITVTSVNDAPTINSGYTYSFAGINEDTTSASVAADTLLTNASWNDVDSGALKGVAITSTTGTGNWQYSTDGSNWTNFGSVSTSNALLLTSTTQIRYLPGNNGETATFAFRAWDQTSGTAATTGTPNYGNATATGGSTAYSNNSGSGTITVTSLNDAPVLDNSGTMTLTSIDEDATSNSGQTVSSIIASAGGDRITDVDTGAVEGIAITALTSGTGSWQYSINGGSSWLTVGAVSNSSALLLRSTDLVRFVPDGQNATTADFTFRVWDQTGATSGAQGTKVDTSTNGGTTPFSTATESAAITVTAANDAPVLTPYTPSLPLTEDSSPYSSTIASLIGSSVTDVDSGAVQGIAITGLTTGGGTLEYSLNGGSTWTAVSGVSTSTALLLRSTDLMRFSPDGNNGGTTVATYRAWDQTSGSAGSTADTTTSGGTTAFSSATDAVTINVSSVNDAPVLTDTILTMTVTEDAGVPSGAVGSLVGSFVGGISDVDTGAVDGIAVVASDETNGTWYYSTNGGSTWNAVGAVNASSSLLLANNASTRLYFAPGADFNGTSASALTIRAWDQTSGTTGSKVSTTSNGGTTAFSSATDVIDVTITATNDAPTITNGYTYNLAGTNEDTTSAGTLASAILTGASWNDVDTAALSGLAITSKTGNGNWQYSTDGSTWTGFGAVSASNALLITSATQVRYVPDGANGETATFSFQAWDQTIGTASTNGSASYGNASVNGGTTAYSSQSAGISLTVTSVNDAPVLDNSGTMTLATLTEDQTSNGGQTIASIISSAGGDRITDIDSGAVEGIAIISLTSGNGSWEYSLNSGANWNAVGSVSDSNALLLRATDYIRFVPDAQTGTTGSITFRAWDQSGSTFGQEGTKVDTSSNGGSTPYSTTTEVASITITDVNDEQVLATNSGATFAENSTGSVITSAILNTTDVDNTSVQLVYTVTSATTTGTLYRSGVALAVNDTFTQSDVNSGMVTYSHNGAEVFSDAFSFNVDDGTGSVTAGTFSLTITPVNDQPVIITSDGGGATAAISQNESIVQVTTVTVSDADLPGDTFTYSIAGGLDASHFTIDGSGQLSFVAPPDYESPVDSDSNNIYEVIVQLSDGVHTDNQTLTITIQDVQESGITVTTTSDVDDTGLGSSYTVEQLYAAGGGADGKYSLREAIIAANNTAGLDIISFAISNLDAGFLGTDGIDGRWQISLAAALPQITDSVILDATTQTIYAGDTNPGTFSLASTVGTSSQSLNTVDRPEIVLVGSSSIVGGFDVNADDVTIRGFAMYGFSNSGAGAINLQNNVQNTLIENNILGTDGISLSDAGASLNNYFNVRSVGADNGTLINNILAYSQSTGFYASTATDGWTVTDNQFYNSGYHFDNGDAIALDGSIGGTIAGNYITGSSTQAIILSGGTTGVVIDDNTLIGNGVGPISGSHVQYDAIAVRSGTTNITISHNIIADNYGAGVTVNDGASGVELTENSFYGNGTVSSLQGAGASGLIGLDLQTTGEDTAYGTAPYYTLNDAGDADSGGNSLQNFPVITAANSDGTQIQIAGTFNSLASGTYRLEFFSSQAYANGYGQGETFLGSTLVTTDGSGNATFDVSWAVSVPAGLQLTATATNTGTHETSEFSVQFAINEAATVVVAGTSLTYQEADPPIVIDNSLTISDVDDTHLESAVIKITGNYLSSEDVLSFTDQNGITGLWNSTTGTLTLSGTATLADYQTALRSVTYSNTSGHPSTLTRTVRFTVNDGGIDSLPQSRDIDITRINDAPILSGSNPNLTGITEDDLTNSGQSVASIITAMGGDAITDVDGDPEGIAIFANNEGTGTWQYQLNGTSTWVDFGVLSTSSALLLNDVDLIRFLPNGEEGTPATFSFYAWDRTSGTAGTLADATTTGGTSSFSTASATAQMDVTDVNDAPTINDGATVVLTGTNEDTPSSGTAANAILTSVGWNDVDPSALQGIAVTATTGNGTWQYSTDGSTWTGFGAVSTTNALLITSSTQVRYVPDGSNSETATFAFLAWDQTTGAASSNGAASYGDPSVNGGTTAYSSESATASLAVTSVNDAPVLDNSGTMQLTTIDEDATSNAGQTVASIIASASGDRITDVDSGALEGIAITSLNSGNGTWEYSLNGGSSWANVGVVNDSSALLLRDTDLVRFVPDTQNATTADFTFRAWDQTGATTGAQGTKVDTSTNGGSTPFSTATESASITVTAVNDAPTATIAPASYSVNEQTVLVLHGTGLSIADVDAGSSTVQATISVTAGTLTASAGSTGVSVSGSGTTTITLTGTLTQINDLLAGNLSGTLTFSENSDTPAASATLTLTASDLGNTGTGGMLTGNDTATINITAVNDTPVVSGPGSAYTVNEQTNLNIHGTGFSFSDVDAASGTLTATLAVGEGIVTVDLGNSGASISSGNGTGSVVLSGTVAQLNALLTGSSTGTVVYYNGSDTPSASTTITLTVNDAGNTGIDPGLTADAFSEEGSAWQTINITATNDAPVLTTNPGGGTYYEGGTGTYVDSGLTVADADSVDFNGGVLTVTISANGEASDRLTLLNGNGVTVSGASISYDDGGGAVVVATFSGGIGNADPLLITFNASADDAAVQAVARQVAFHLVTDDPSGLQRTITLQVTDGDGGTSSLESRVMNVTPVNDSPTIATNTGSTVAEGSTGNIITTAMLNEGDPDDSGTGLTYTLTSAPSNGTLYLAGFGALGLNDTFTQADIDSNKLTYDHDGSQTSSDSFNFTLSDGGEDGATTANGTFNITVTNVNDAPTDITPNGFSVNELTNTSGGYSLGTLATVDDDPGDTFTYTIVGGADAANFSIGGAGSDELILDDGVLDYETQSSYTVRVRTTDAAGAYYEEDLLISVNDLNDAPMITSNGGGATASVNVAENTTTVTTVTATDADVPSQTLSYSIIGGADAALFTIDNSSGALSFQAAPDYEATADAGADNVYDVIVQVSDGAGGADTQAIAITVTPVNEGPAFTSLDDNPTYIEAGSAVVLDSTVAITDPELTLADNFAGSTLDIRRNGGANAEDLFTNSGLLGALSQGGNFVYNGTTIGTVTTLNSGVLTVTFNANATSSLLNSAIRSLAYANNSDTPPGSVTLQWTFNDNNSGSQGSGGTLSTTGAMTVNITASNDAPVVSAPASPLNATEQVNLNLHGVGFGINDVDAASSTLTATLSVGEGIITLSAGNSGVAIASGNGTNNVVVTGTLSQLNALLAGTSTGTIVYYNGSDTPSASTTVKLTVNDHGNTGIDPGLSGDATSEEGIASQTINITATNDNPYNVGTLPSTITVVEDVLGNVDLSAIDLYDIDAAGGALQVFLSTSTGGLLYASNGTGVTVTNSGTGSITLTGSLVNLNAYLDVASTIKYQHGILNTNGPAADSIAVAVSDQGNTGLGGGSTVALGSVTVDITAVNDAPVLDNSANMLLSSITEDTIANSGDTVANIIASAGGNRITDVDAGAVEGIAITSSTTTNGVWQYSLDGGATWLNVGPVSDSSALLLRAADSLRFLPNQQNGGTSTFTFRAWDQTSGIAGSFADVSVNGGTTAYSTTFETAQIVVSSVNDAPTINNGMTANLPGTNEDTVSAGTAVSTILSSVGKIDVDSGALSGLAITGQTGNGTWQYSTDGVAWTSFGAVSNSNALLLSANTQVRYTPDGLNSETATFSFVAWDQTTGSAATNGSPSYGNTATSGGTSAFSNQTAQAGLAVSSNNDAPSITNGASVNLPATNEDTTSAATSVTAILTSTNHHDADTGALRGIAITGKNGHGTWQYSTDGVTWNGFGAVSTTQALLLTSSTQVRYVPDGLNGETASFSFVAWDQTAGTASTNASANYATPGSGGGNSAFSSQTATALLNVASVNDAPSVQAPSAATIQGVPLEFSAANGNAIVITDVDNVSAIFKVTLTGSGGQVALGSLSGITLISGTITGDSALTIQGTLGAINVALNGLQFTATSGLNLSLQIALTDTGNGQPNDAQTVLINVPINSTAGQLPNDDRYPGGSTDDNTDGSDDSTGKGNIAGRVPTDSIPGMAPKQPTLKAPRNASEVNQSTIAGGLSDENQFVEFATTLNDSVRNSLTREIISRHQMEMIAAPRVDLAGQLKSSTTKLEPLFVQLDALEEAETNSLQIDSLIVGSALGALVVGSVSWVLWGLRIGALASQLTSVIPCWADFDPLPILDYSDKSSTSRRRGAAGSPSKSDDEVDDLPL